MRANATADAVGGAGGFIGIPGSPGGAAIAVSNASGLSGSAIATATGGNPRFSFGNGGMAGPKDTLFFAAGPHRWRGASEIAVHGLFGSISAD